METPEDMGPRSEQCPSDLQLDTAWLFEGPTGGSVKAHLDTCPRCQARWEEMKQVADTFDNEVRPQTVDTVVQQIQSERPEKQGNVGGDRRIIGYKAFVLAASITLVVGIIWFALGTDEKDSASLYLGDKGTAGLEVWCRRSGRVFQVHEGDTLYAEDMLRFVPRFSEEVGQYVMVVSLDGAGRISRYHPSNQEMAVPVAHSGKPLDGSIILDDSVGPERIFLLVSDKPFAFQDVKQALRDQWRRHKPQLRAGPLGLGLIETSLIFDKERE